MSQIVFIHGGETFEDYDSYLSALRSWDYEPQIGEPVKKWRDTLSSVLGTDGQVLMPSMPSKYNAKYIEWKIWFDKVLPFVQPGAILIGHSLGGTFLTKYLSEETLTVSLAATMLVAAIYDEESETGSLADFVLPDSLKKLQSQGGKLFLYHSEDDPVVPFSELSKFQSRLPNSIVRTFTNRGHFLSPEFPEILEDIQSVL